MDFFWLGFVVYGQQVLEGISWNTVPYALGVAVVVIVGHLIWRLIRGPRRRA